MTPPRIVAKLERENDVVYAAGQVTVAGGAKQVIYNALAATVGEADEVIVPAPYWVSYPDMVLACDATPVVVPCGGMLGSSSRPTPWQARSPPERAG